jgi:hypothetical protein
MLHRNNAYMGGRLTTVKEFFVHCTKRVAPREGLLSCLARPDAGEPAAVAAAGRGL